MRIMIGTAIFLITFSLPAWAQESFDKMYCSDYHSARVKIVSDSSARKLSEAGMTASGQSVIRVNSGQLKNLSKNARSYAVNFSCASLVLGHLVKGAEDIYDYYDQVGNADCWAVGKLFYNDQIDKNGITALEEEINQLNRENWSHFPGPVRVVSLNDTCELKPIN